MGIKFERSGYTFEFIPEKGWKVNEVQVSNFSPNREDRFPFDSYKKVERPTLMVVANSLCCLRCKYCYDKARTDNSKSLSVDTFKDSFCHVKEKYKEGSKFGVIVYGGEPLLNKDLIRYLIGSPDFHRIHIVTGLGAELILNEKVDYCFSIDPPSRDYPRVNLNGDSFYHESIKRISPYANTGRGIYIRSTLTRNSWNYRELYLDLKNTYPNNDVSIKPEPVFDSGGMALDSCSISSLRTLFREDFESFRRLHDFKKHYNSYAVDFMRDFLSRDFLFGGCGSFNNRLVISTEKYSTFCNEVGVSPEGREFVSWETEEEREKVIGGVVKMPELCRNCDIRDFCGIICPLRLFQKDDSACKYRRMVVEEGISSFFKYTPLPTIFKWMMYKYSRDEETKRTIAEEIFSVGESIHG